MISLLVPTDLVVVARWIDGRGIDAFLGKIVEPIRDGSTSGRGVCNWAGR